MHCTLCRLSAPRTTRRVDNACCWWMDMLRRKVKRVRRDAPTFEWKRLEGDPRKWKKRNADRRGGQKNGDGDEDGECVHEWIVVLLNARKRSWKKKKDVIVSLTHGVVSRYSRHGLPEKFRRLFSRSSRDTPGYASLSLIRYAFRQHTKLPTLKAPSRRRFRRRARPLALWY